MNRPSALHDAIRRPTYLISSGVFRALLYVATSAILPATVVFFVAVPGAPARVIVAIAITATIIVIAPFIAKVERRRVVWIGQMPIRDTQRPTELGWQKRFAYRLKRSAAWRELAGVLAAMVFGTAAGAAVLSLVGLIALVAGAPGRFATGSGIWGGPLSPLDIAGIAATPLILGVLGYAIGGMALIQASTTRWLLAPRTADLRREVAHLAASRSRMLRSFEGELRRIERDLHDGAQQRIVEVTIALGAAELDLEQLTTAADLTPIRQALERAHSAAEAALGDLRSTVRSIHPRVLADHGLMPALRDLVAFREPPVEIVGSVVGRLRGDVELCAYFVASEALANAAKHSPGSPVQIELSVEDGVLSMRVRDSGAGGADLTRGTGLAGLVERAEAIGGDLRIRSRRDAGTTIEVLLPARPVSERP